MSSISSIAFSGMQSAAAQFQTSANNIARSGSSNDLADDIVDAVTAQANVSISLQMIRAEKKMTQALVDILV
ncbi:MAG: hypothetical protein Q8M24_22985 [Pseudolabrys sp.]|nr:hypothetical protein [Pseudolabrys sp.]MDP2298318.1 hypothetical protein [Pseudolabrys sp.]